MIPPDISAVVPVQYQIYAIVAGLVLKYLCEFYSAVRAGGGLKRILLSFWLGEQLPTVIAQDYKQELSAPPFNQPKDNS